MSQLSFLLWSSLAIARVTAMTMTYTDVLSNMSLGGVKACHPADADMDIVVSTGCNNFQNWQAEVLLNSAVHAGQCGRITRIVAGCDAAVEREKYATHPGGGANKLTTADALLKSTYPNLVVHRAPSIPEAQEFPWFNKPWSFYHWLQSKPELGRAVAIIDPDEFFLQPLTQTGGVTENGLEQAQQRHDTTRTTLIRAHEHLNLSDVVQPGMAVAQRYGLGSSFLRLFDKNTICPGQETSPCAKLTQKYGVLYYPAGPPYILHRDDFRKVMPTWWELMKPVYEKDKGDIQADMYAYIYAAAHNDVKHALFDNYMVSNVDAQEEPWKWIDDIQDMSCHNPRIPEGKPRPGFIHAASHFKACSSGDPTKYDIESCPLGGELWNFHKGHVPGEILECDHPLLMPPPDDFFNAQVRSGQRRAKRGAFMICNLVHMVNRAALEYKQKFCPANFMEKKCTRITLGDPRVPFKATNPWHYPLARVDADCCPECEALAKRSAMSTLAREDEYGVVALEMARYNKLYGKAH